jgi:hypothetical protein
MSMIIRLVFRLVKKLIYLLIKLIAVLWHTRWGKALLGIVVLLSVPELYQSGMWPLTIIICLIGLTLILVGIVQMTTRSSKLVPKHLRHLWQKVSASVLLKKDKLASIPNLKIFFK